MGRLRFRTSYGQNVLNHSREVAFLAGIRAKELGLNGHVATRAAFLHDIGKAIDREVDGTHLELGIELLRKYGESEEVLGAVLTRRDRFVLATKYTLSRDAGDPNAAAAPPTGRRSIVRCAPPAVQCLSGTGPVRRGPSRNVRSSAAYRSRRRSW